MSLHITTPVFLKLSLTTCFFLSACSNFDGDFRGALGGDLSTTFAAQTADTQERPKPDQRGVISYPSYQIAVSRAGDRLSDVANRVGISPQELGRYNGINPETKMRRGEVLVLPSRVSEPIGGPAATGIETSEINIETIAQDAIDRADQPVVRGPERQEDQRPDPNQPLRHQVQSGETSYGIARDYGVSVRALAEWNGLGSDLGLREGQHLIIPIKTTTNASKTNTYDAQTTTASLSSVAQGTSVPTIGAPSLKPTPKPVNEPRQARMSKPVPGKIKSTFDADNAGYILIAATPGETVRAAADGKVRLVSKDVEGEKIVVIDHGNSIQTAYSFIDNISVKKGHRVKRGQAIAKASKSEFEAIQFLTFKGTEPIDPLPYLQN